MKKIELLMAVLAMSCQLIAQNIPVTGIIVDGKDASAIPGVNVVIKGTTIGTITDLDGKFSINVPGGKGIFVISAIGYKKEEVLLKKDQRIVNVSMSEDTEILDEVVVIGYGSVKKRDLTGSVASVSAAKIAEVPVLSTAQALQGRVAGVLVTNSSSDPGANPSILIRGKRSMKASNDPLYVVDGIPMSGGIGEIPPSDIESIDVLKDASATAIYGARGANGVILITTKKGKPGKTQVEYSGYYGIQTIQNKTELMNGAEYAEYLREGYRATGDYTSDVPNKELDFLIVQAMGGNTKLNTDPSNPFANATDPYTWQSVAMAYDENGNYDPSKVRSGALWWDEVEKTGIITDHSLTIRGGTDKTNYSFGATYYKNEGIYRNKNYQRFSTRLNLNHEVNKWLKIGAQTQFSRSLNEGGKSMQDNWRVNPLGRLYDENGELTKMTSGTDTQWWNPLQYLVEGAIDSRKKVNRFMGSYYGEVQLPVDGLRFRSNIGMDFISTQDYSFNASNTRNDAANQAKNATADRYMWTIENLLFYDKTFGKHNLGVTLLQSVQRDVNESNSIDVEDIPSDDLLYYYMASGLKINGVGSDHQVWSLASFMARVNYNYNNRYYATVSARYDGSSRLADGHKWVAFPSFALAWRINEESFLKHFQQLDNLKLRFGYGVTANSSVSPYQTKGTLSQLSYNFGENLVYGYAPGGLPDKSLTWEKTGQWNLGIDFAFFKNRISGTVDIYLQNTTDLLLDRLLPVVSGFESVTTNVGSTRNKGFEVSLTTVNVQSRSFRWTTDWMFSTNKEEIVELYNGKVDDVGSSWFIGEALNVYYDIKKAGIWQDTPEDLAEMKKFNDKGGKFTVGSIRVEDINSDYKINAEDRVLLGQARPNHTFSLINSFNYKNWDLSVFLYGALGGMLKNEMKYGHQANRNNNLKYNYWTPTNPTNEYPRPVATKDPDNVQTLYYEKADFLRFKNITLGYSLPKSVIQKASISNCRFYLTAQNPWVITGYTGVDPEGATGYAAPSVSSWMFGVNLSF